MPFAKNDPNINRDGRPKKGITITDIMQEYLKGDYAVGEKKIKRIQLFVAKAFNMAMKGDVGAIRLIWNYVDGMPVQKLEHGGELQVAHELSEELREMIGYIVEENDEV